MNQHTPPNQSIAVLIRWSFAKPIILLATALSLVTWYWFHQLGLAMAYNDSMSHVNLARFVVDNLEPGLAQIGGVWLPLSHVLAIPFVWIDWAWQTGFAGSIVSMIAYVAATWGVYATVRELTNKQLAGVVAAVAFMVNPNMLYLQSTALTEPLYVGVFTVSMFAFVKWIKTGYTAYLILLGALGFMQVLTRYDGWFVVAVQGLAIAVHQYVYLRHSMKVTIGKLVLFSFPVAFGVALWLLWNALIFGHPLFFATGPYSAKAQQTVIESQAGLITKGDVVVATKAYLIVLVKNIGAYLAVIALMGSSALLFINRQIGRWDKSLILGVLASPIFFNILALYLGFSILNVPELGWNPGQSDSGQWFNVRYGILALPSIAILLGVLAGTRTAAAIALVLIIALQTATLVKDGIITITDGTIGSSAFVFHDVSAALGQRVQTEQLVLMSTAQFNPIAFKSGLQLKQFIHEGASNVWTIALANPQEHAEWIVMASNGDKGDRIYQELVINQNNQFLEAYTLEYEDVHARIYRRTDIPSTQGSVKLNSQLKGLHVHHLFSDKSLSEIEQTLVQMKSEGIVTARLEYTDQPQYFGEVDQNRVNHLNQIVNMAERYGITLLPIKQ